MKKTMKNKVIWLEDLPQDVADLMGYLEDEKELDVQDCAVPQRFKMLLDDNRNEICLIIVDIMLYGVNDLKRIGFNVNTTPYDAGWYIIENLLRPDNPREGKIHYGEIPLLIVSIRKLEDESKRRYKSVERVTESQGYNRSLGYVVKTDLGWKRKFRKFVDDVLKNRNGG